MIWHKYITLPIYYNTYKYSELVSRTYRVFSRDTITVVLCPQHHVSTTGRCERREFVRVMWERFRGRIGDMLRLASQNDGSMTSSSEVTSSSSSAATAGFSATSMFINAFFSTNSSPMTRESLEFLQDLDDSFGEQPVYTHQQRYHQDTIMNRFMTQHNTVQTPMPMISGKLLKHRKIRFPHTWRLCFFF